MVVKGWTDYRMRVLKYGVQYLIGFKDGQCEVLVEIVGVVASRMRRYWECGFRQVDSAVVVSNAIRKKFCLTDIGSSL